MIAALIVLYKSFTLLQYVKHATTVILTLFQMNTYYICKYFLIIRKFHLTTEWY